MANKAAKTSVKVGQTYIKTGRGVDSYWEVEHILEYVDLPMHARLVERGGNERTITVATAVLEDPKQWKPYTGVQKRPRA
ncbi:MAG: hypothetical protein FWF01_01770 [Alphaproteobacteria bacterium]|nr:hypothetical protein [Alphaproteobacteria bacterium]